MQQLLAATSFMYSSFWRFTDQNWFMMIVYVGLALFFTYLAIQLLDEWGTIVAVPVGILSPLAIEVYMNNACDPFWFCDFNKMGLLLGIVGAIAAFAMIGILFGVGIGLMKNIFYIFRNPISAILFAILGVFWFCSGCVAIGAFMDNHPFLTFFFFIGLIPTAKTPTIHVDGVGDITGHGYDGGSSFHGDDGNEYHYDGHKWH